MTILNWIVTIILYDSYKKYSSVSVLGIIPFLRLSVLYRSNTDFRIGNIRLFSLGLIEDLRVYDNGPRSEYFSELFTFFTKSTDIIVAYKYKY